MLLRQKCCSAKMDARKAVHRAFSNFSSVRRSPTMRPQQDFSRSFCSCCCPPLLSCSFLVPFGLLSHYLSTSLVVFLCFLFPSSCPYSATIGSLCPSILVTCPNHVSLHFLILSTNVTCCPKFFLVTSFRILSLLDLPSILPSQLISATSILLSSSFLRHQHLDPYIITY